MLTWISENAGTLLVGLAVLTAIVFVVRKLYENKKNGKCGCGCDTCSAAGFCRKEKK